MCPIEFAASLQGLIAAGSTLRLSGFRSLECPHGLRENCAFDPLSMRQRLTVAGRRLTSVAKQTRNFFVRLADQVAQLYGGLKVGL